MSSLFEVDVKVYLWHLIPIRARIVCLEELDEFVERFEFRQLFALIFCHYFFFRQRSYPWRYQGFLSYFKDEYHKQISSGIRLPGCDVEIFALSLTLLNETNLRFVCEDFFDFTSLNAMFERKFINYISKPNSTSQAHLSITLPRR